MFLLRRLDSKLEEIPLIIFFFLMVIIMGVQVFCRYVLNNSLSWSEELTRYMFIWCGFLSISYCVRNNNSIRIEMLTNLLPLKWQKVVRFIEYALMIFFFGCLCLGSWEFLVSSFVSKQVSPAAGLPMYVVQIAPLVGSVLALIRTFQSLHNEMRGRGRLGSDA